MSVYGTSPIKRQRRTKAELEELDLTLADIVAEIQPATVRQVFYQAVVRGLVHKDEGKVYKLVQRRLVKLREDHTIPYGWIADTVAAELVRRSYPTEVHVERLAVSRQQIDEYGLPTRPTKTTDSRARKFMREYGTGSVELDALPPAALRGLVRENIERHMNAERLRVMKLAEEQERDLLREVWTS